MGAPPVALERPENRACKPCCLVGYQPERPVSVGDRHCPIAVLSGQQVRVHDG